MITTKPNGKFTVKVAEHAKKFDAKTQALINKHMCSEVCPCKDEEWIRSKYEQLPEQYVNQYNRTNQSPNLTNFQPFTFSKDTQNSYETFTECMHAWTVRGASDPDLSSSDKEVANKLADELNTPNSILEGGIDLSIYKELETAHACSGMCSSALFFFKLKITTNPPPMETCFKMV